MAANTAQGEIVAPQPPRPPAIFRVAADSVERHLAALQKENNPLKLAMFYASEGMLDAAGCTLKKILVKNPQNTAARRLLARVERWKQENQVTVQRCGPLMTQGDKN